MTVSIARPLASHALSYAQRLPGVSYAEVRWVKKRRQDVGLRDARPHGIRTLESEGFAIRLIGNGAWGFSCTPEPTEEALTRAVNVALAVARASASLGTSRVRFPEREAERGSYRTPFRQHPFDVSISDKLWDLEQAELLLRGSPISSTEAWASFTELEKLLLTSEGSDLHQTFIYGEVGISAVAASSGRVQRRSYPATPGMAAQQAGYELVTEAELVQHAPRVRQEAIDLLEAKACPEGAYDLILGSSQMALQIHESCGHPSELDRALGSEISLAGGSFLQPELLGKLRYGSSLVNLVADSTSARGLGTFGWDDEGTRAGTFPLVHEGIFVDYLSSRETAAQLGRPPTATMRASDWNRLPLIRMPNVSLTAHEGNLEDLIRDTRRGIFLDTNKSWSIDDQRLDFQFSCELGWLIENGKRSQLLRDARYTGRTPAFWRSCDAITGPEEAKIWGLSTCGKGEPIQDMAVAHGAPPARFLETQVGST